ncbi:hypothetical protein FJY84_00400 [Candidatus Bathyarchaeota archaeon]|nr:hypothetical protein [Candidatus Bathyarchaeota archaeon]
MKFDVNRLIKNSVSVQNYTQEPGIGFEAFNKKRREYIVNEVVIEKLKKSSDKILVFVFSAEWCPDCYRNVPILDLISEKTGIEVRVFGHIKKGVAGSSKKWAVPPSPQEVDEFNVQKIPHIIILNKQGEKIGEIIENPPLGKTLEETVLDIIK